MSAPRWNEDALTEMKRIIHLMDMLITGLGKAVNDINRQDYDEFYNDMRAIIGVVNLLRGKTRDLLDLKTGKGGKRPFWYIVGEDILWYCVRIQRTEEIVRGEIRRNEWDVILTRLDVGQKKCVEVQKKILEMMPREKRKEISEIASVSADAVQEYLDLVETVKAVGAESTGNRWRRQSK